MKSRVWMILLAGTLWGIIGLFSTPLTEAGMSAMEITGVRSLLTVVLMGGFLLLRSPGLFRIRLRDLWCFFGMGVLSFVLFNFCYLQSMRLNESLSVAAILLYTAPVFVMLGSLLFFREKMTWRKAVALALAFGGCVLVSGPAGGKELSLPGILFGILSGLGYALYSLFGRKALERYSPLTCIFYTFAFASVATVPFLFSVPVKLAQQPVLLLPAAGIAVLSTFLPYLLYTAGLERISASKASILACVEPVVATLAGLLFYRQTLSPAAVCGTLCVLAAVVLLSGAKNEKRAS